MSTEENKAFALQWFAEGWNRGIVTVADVIFSHHYLELERVKRAIL